MHLVFPIPLIRLNRRLPARLIAHSAPPAFYLVLVASEDVHKIAAQTARLAFGILLGIFALMSISSQMAARRMQGKVEALHEEMERMEEMSPEEAGKAVGEFPKGLQKSVEPEADDTPPPDPAD